MQTESSSNHRNLEQLDFLSLVQGINREDALLSARVASEASHISPLVRGLGVATSTGIKLFIKHLRLLEL